MPLLNLKRYFLKVHNIKMNIRLLGLLILAGILLVSCGDSPAKPKSHYGSSSSGEADSVKHKIKKVGDLLEPQKKLIRLLVDYRNRAKAGDKEAAWKWYALTFDKQGEYHKWLELADEEERVIYEDLSAAEQRMVDQQNARLGDAVAELKKTIGLGDESRLAAARLGSPEAQWDLYLSLSSHDDSSSGRKISGKEEPRPISCLVRPVMLQNHSYMLDEGWIAPSGPWDTYYVEGRFECDGQEFTPRDWLLKAAASSPEYRPRLAALDFISARHAGARLEAAKSILALATEQTKWWKDDLFGECLAAIHYHGIGTPVDLVRAAEVMMESQGYSLKARGVDLICERNLVVWPIRRPFEGLPERNQKLEGVREAKLLYLSACSRYGYLGKDRSAEDAYYYLYEYLLVDGVSFWGALSDNKSKEFGDPDSVYARMRISELERKMQAGEVAALQDKCLERRRKFDRRTVLGQQ